MPNKAFIVKMFDNTEIEQAVMLTGIHGIGKSSIIAGIFKKMGYKVITIFLGQKADPGDVIGLPHKHEIVIEDGSKIWVTTFASMDWWPTDPNGKYIIFLDELNRAKPEMMQCIMDLVLNRMMNGRALPEHTRIIAAINPSNNGQYQVEDLDPALLDRFNVYELKPDVDEWISWAIETQIHDAVIGFITKHGETFLDPPTEIGESGTNSGTVTPSRRSWERVSNNFKKFPDLFADKTFLQTYLNGIVGIPASAAFHKYLNTLGVGLSAKTLLENYDRKVEETLKSMNQTDQISLMDDCVTYFKSNFDKLIKSKETSEKLTKNLERAFDHTKVETMAHFFSKLQNEHNKKEKWPELVASSNKNLATKFQKIIRSQEV